MRLHPNSINRDSGIEIPEAWMPTIKKSTKESARYFRTLIEICLVSRDAVVVLFFVYKLTIFNS